MRRLRDRQRGFAEALLDRALPVPQGLVGPDGEPSARRFGVYRNNVVVSLTEALKESFPAVCRIVGDEFFRAMARAYVLASPPNSPILLEYGASFAGFIAGFAPAASLPYLPDVARIEHAWIAAYHAPEATPLAAPELASIPVDQVVDMRLSLHPSLRIVRSRFPALTIWRMNVADGVAGPVDFDISEDILVIRPSAEVEVRSIPPGGAEFVETLAAGLAVSAAADAAINVDERFSFETNLMGLIRAGAFIGYCVLYNSTEQEFSAA